MRRSISRPSRPIAPGTDAEASPRFRRARPTVLGVLLLTAALGGQSLFADVYRWVDENGDVHYSESLPPDFEDRSHDRMNQDGLVVDENLSLKREPPPPPPPKKKNGKGELPRDKSGNPRPEPLYSKAELQARLDAMLLLRYPSEQELIDAMNVEINQLTYDRELIQTTLQSVRQTYRQNVREAGNRQRAGVEVDDGMSQKLATLRARLAQNEASLALLEQRESTIREKFDAERTRYRRLIAEREATEQES